MPSETEVPAGLRLLEDVIYNIVIRRSQPDWLPFVPGASYWVPPRKRPVGVVRIMRRITEPLSAEEQSLTTVRGWSSSSYYGKNCVEIDPKLRHEVPRQDVNQIICFQCGNEQDIQQNCSDCGVCFGKYFCGKCRLFDDDVSKKQLHCDGCGICRTGSEENFFHCEHCGCCYVNSLKGTHRCIERAMHQNCPGCFVYMFDSTKDISDLSCGHTIHLDCSDEMTHHRLFSCPICSRSICDMVSVWRKLDQEIASTPMPEVYKNKMVWILCNDCGMRSNIHFHIVAHKCPGCNSYNTRQTQGASEECVSG